MIIWAGVVAATIIFIASALARAVIPGLLGAIFPILIGVIISRFRGPPRRVQEQQSNLQRRAREKKDKIGQIENQSTRLLREVSISAEPLEAGIEAFSQRIQDQLGLSKLEKDLEILEERRKRLSSIEDNLG